MTIRRVVAAEAAPATIRTVGSKSVRNVGCLEEAYLKMGCSRETRAQSLGLGSLGSNSVLRLVSEDP